MAATEWPDIGSERDGRGTHQPPRFVWAWCRGSRGCPSGRTDIRLAVLGSGAGAAPAICIGSWAAP